MEDYPRTMAAQIKIAAAATTGNRFVRLWTSQGVTTPMPYVVGDLPELVAVRKRVGHEKILADPGAERVDAGGGEHLGADRCDQGGKQGKDEEAYTPRRVGGRAHCVRPRWPRYSPGSRASSVT